MQISLLLDKTLGANLATTKRCLLFGRIKSSKEVDVVGVLVVDVVADASRSRLELRQMRDAEEADAGRRQERLERGKRSEGEKEKE